MSLDERFGALLAGDPAGMSDPYPIYRGLHEAGAVYDWGGTLVVSGYAATREVIRRDGQQFVNALGLRGEAAEKARSMLSGEHLEAFDALAAWYSLVLPERDRDDHQRLRSIVHRSFTPRRMERLTATIHGFVIDLLDGVQKLDQPDIVHASNQLPMMVMAELLGIPQSDLDRIQASNAKLASVRAADAPPEALLVAREGLDEMFAYCNELVERHQPGSDATDVVSLLVEAERAGTLTRAEFVAMLVFLLGSGHETTVNLLSVGTIALLSHPDQWRLLTDEPEELASAATEELLRYVAPVQFVSRLALTDCEIAGTSIRAGQTLLLLLAEANRDADVFSAPDTLDLLRPDAKEQLALGHGVHFCLGASLVRLEGRLFFSELAKRMPQLELTTDSFEWVGHVQVRRPSAIPVAIASGTR